MSLGIDPLLSGPKYCSFDCTYCQLGDRAQLAIERNIFVPTDLIIEEIKALPADCKIDYYTFSGSGEPTLAANLGDMIRQIKAIRPEGAAKVAVISNASTIMRPDVQSDLRLADLVLLKLEAHDQETFERLNRPVKGLRLIDIVNGIKDFRKLYEGRLALQIMFTDDNRHQADQLALMARQLAPDEVQLNTPLRPSPVKPLPPEEMALLKKPFLAAGLVVRSVYEEEKQAYVPFDDKATEKRHGKFKGTVQE